jgi:hypothetical protein
MQWLMLKLAVLKEKLLLKLNKVVACSTQSLKPP